MRGTSRHCTPCLLSALISLPFLPRSRVATTVAEAVLQQGAKVRRETGRACSPRCASRCMFVCSKLQGHAAARFGGVIQLISSHAAGVEQRAAIMSQSTIVASLAVHARGPRADPCCARRVTAHASSTLDSTMPRWPPHAPPSVEPQATAPAARPTTAAPHGQRWPAGEGRSGAAGPAGSGERGRGPLR